jgi:hypothetical protein
VVHASVAVGGRLSHGGLPEDDDDSGDQPDELHLASFGIRANNSLVFNSAHLLLKSCLWENFNASFYM